MSFSKKGQFHILVINPGSTSTKLAVFEGGIPIHSETIAHPHKQLAAFPRISDQYQLRRDAVLSFLARNGVAVDSLDAVAARGGILRPLASGTYVISERMLQELREPEKERDHVVNLAAQIAHEIARQGNLPAFVVDPVCVDELEQLARVSGLPEIERRSLSHALSLKSAARRAAVTLESQYADINLVVVHMGGGISVSAHRKGRMVDVNQALDGTGPFSPERVGGLPCGDVLRLAFSGEYTYPQLFRRFTRHGGLLAHLGTNDALEVERRIAQGDEHARLIYEAMAYQIAKEIGLMSTVLKGRVDGVVLTGNLAHSSMLVSWIRERVEWIAPVLVYPGQDEMQALAQGVLRVLRGEEEAKQY
ncbi:MAG: butyrate kinase [Anaerolineae bacterium SM23_84]|nr:MAG: butyrate kinase [Anaerolineae bacterium SM23_84]